MTEPPRLKRSGWRDLRDLVTFALGVGLLFFLVVVKKTEAPVGTMAALLMIFGPAALAAWRNGWMK
jgi:hypothetical protein